MDLEKTTFMLVREELKVWDGGGTSLELGQAGLWEFSKRDYIDDP